MSKENKQKSFTERLKKIIRKIKNRCLQKKLKKAIKLSEFIKSECRHKSEIKDKVVIRGSVQVFKEGKSLNGKTSFRLREIKEELPDCHVRVIPYAKVFSNEGYIISDEGIPLSDYSAQTKYPLKRMQRGKKPKFVDANVAVIASETGSKNFYHWMIESIPRLYLIYKSGFEVDKYYVSAGSRYQKQALKIIGVKEEDIISAEADTFIQAKNLIVPDLLNNWESVKMTDGISSIKPKYIPKWVCEFHEKYIMSKASKSESGNERIYITRKHAKNRRIKNENEVIKILKDYNFKTVALEKISFKEQMDIFYNAKYIISPHGAGLTNLLYCQKGTKVIELFSPNDVREFFWMLSESKELDYNYLICESEIDDKVLLDEDILVNIEEFKRILKKNIK